jgi:hypothetical protein
MIDIKNIRYHTISIWDMEYQIKELDIMLIKPMVLSKLQEMRFCPSKILQYAKSCNQYLQISYGPITLHYLYIDKLHESIYKILRTLKYCLLIHKNFNMTKNFDIYIVYSPFKRYIQSKGPVDTIHINGGFTSHNDNDIFIIRCEEYTKVILHEMLHHVKKIHNDNWSLSNILKLKNTFNIDSKTTLIPNEAVVELWATISYLSFLSKEYNISFKTLLKIELQYSLYQSKKLLKKQNNKPWFEYSNAYCYIIFKTILFDAYIKNKLPANNPNVITEYLIAHKDVIKKPKMTDNFDKGLRMMKLSDL